MTTSLSMDAFMDDDFTSSNATRMYRTNGGYVEGLYQEGTEVTTSHRVNIQPLNPEDINFLELGGQRIVDTRKIYVNSGDVFNLSDIWEFESLDGQFKCLSLDDRGLFGRSYAKIYVTRLDL